jgi:hypothetical protein
MKSIFTILNICFFITTNFCQEILSDPGHEIFCGSEHYSNQITYNLQPIGTIWDVVWLPHSKVFSIDTDGSSDGGIFVAEPNKPISYWKGYNYIASTWNVPTEDFGFGFYKLSVMNKFIYLDWRDTRYGNYNYCNGHCADIWIKYDGQDGNVYLKNDASEGWGNPVVSGCIFSIWDLKNQGIPLTSGVPSFWQNCLVQIPTPTNHPRLIWGSHPTFGATNYKLYRAISDHPANPLSLTYTLIATTNSTTFEYTDVDALLNGDSYYAYYYVKAYRTSPSPNYSDASNYVNTVADFEFNKGKTASIEHFEYKFSLGENFPNPFNLNTFINYSIKDAGIVKIKLFDILGSEVAELVNEIKDAGNHSVEFNASNLPSGIYIYTLQVNSFSASEKMLLLK